MTSAIKILWKKTRKNKAKNTNGLIIEETRDEETDVHQTQKTAMEPSLSGAFLSTLSALNVLNEGSSDVRDDTEAQPNEDADERSQTRHGVNSDSTTKKPFINKIKNLNPTRTKKSSSKNTGYNKSNEHRLSPTSSQNSSYSDNYSWNDCDSYQHHNRGNHIYIRDNESVSLLTKDYSRDPNILDVLSLKSVMDVVNKGIMTPEGYEVHNMSHRSREECENLKDEDENSVDEIMNCLFNAFDCFGDNSSIAESRCYVDRYHRNSVKRKDRRRLSENSFDADVGSKSVSWADDNLILDGSFKDDYIDDRNREDGTSSRQRFRRSFDGDGSKASVQSSIKNSLMNVKKVMCGIKSSPVDANSVYEQHRSAMRADNGSLAKNVATNQDDQNWRNTVNDTSTDPNWRATVNDRLNYQGPNSPASSNCGNLSPAVGLYGIVNGQSPSQVLNTQAPTQIPQNHINTNQNMLTSMPMPGHQPVHTLPSPPNAMPEPIPSISNRSIGLNMSVSVESTDIGDKYGMKGEIDQTRPVTDRHISYNEAVNGGMRYGNNEHPTQYATPQYGGSTYGNGSHSGAANQLFQPNPYHDPRAINCNMRQENHAYGNNGTVPQASGIVQSLHENYGPSIPMTLAHEQQKQHVMPISPVSPQRTFMA